MNIHIHFATHKTSIARSKLISIRAISYHMITIAVDKSGTEDIVADTIGK